MPSGIQAALQRRLGNAGLGQIIQAKLTISQPNDIYEQEADRVADAVMRMPDPAPTTAQPPGTQLQRHCPACDEELRRQSLEEEELIQTKPLGSQLPRRAAGPAIGLPGRRPQSLATRSDSTLARQTVSGIQDHQLDRASETEAPSEVSTDLETAIHGLAGRGRPLPAPVRAFMEPRFGADFSGVRVHADGQANELARAVNARAFTVGRDVVFGRGQYSPSAAAGGRLLAHELAHVVQQPGGQASSGGLGGRGNEGRDRDALFQDLTTSSVQPSKVRPPPTTLRQSSPLIQRQPASTSSRPNEENNGAGVTTRAEVAGAIRGLVRIQTVVSVGRALLEQPWSIQSGAQSRQVIPLNVGAAQFAIRREWLQSLYAVAERQYLSLLRDVAGTSVPSSEQARLAARGAYPRSLREAVAEQESGSAAESVAVTAGRATLQTVTSLLLNLELSSPFGLGLYHPAIAGIAFGLQLLNTNDPSWWDELPFHTVNHLFGFCAGYEATMRGQRLPRNQDGVTQGFGRSRIPIRVEYGADIGRRVGLAKMELFAERGFDRADVRSNARELNLFQAAFNGVRSEYADQADAIIRAGVSRDHERAIPLLVEFNEAQQFELRSSAIRAVIHHVGQHQEVPPVRFMRHPVPAGQ